MSKLFILGNGFDIVHDLNTSYKGFKSWLISEFCNGDYGTMKINLSEKLNNILINRDSDLIESIKRNPQNTISVNEQLERVYDYRKFKTGLTNELVKLRYRNDEDLSLGNFPNVDKVLNLVFQEISNISDFSLELFEQKMEIVYENMLGKELIEKYPPPKNPDIEKQLLVLLLIEVIDLATGGNWNDFENSLGKIKFSNLTSVLLPNISDYSDIDYLFWVLLNIIPQINTYFKAWIQTIDIISTKPKEDFVKLIKSYEDTVLTFNYTCLAEQIYHVANVCHIHGKVGDDNIIIGHGNNSTNISFRDYEAMLSNGTKKPVKACIAKHEDFFSSLLEINAIYSFGFSFGKVDLPYISMLCECIQTNHVKWYLNDFNSIDERKNFMTEIVKCGFCGEFDEFHIA